MGKKKGKGQGPAPRSSNNSISEPGQQTNQETTSTQQQQPSAALTLPTAALPLQTVATPLATPAATVVTAASSLPTAAASSSNAGLPLTTAAITKPIAVVMKPTAEVQQPTASSPAGAKSVTPAGTPIATKAPFVSPALQNIPQGFPTGPLPGTAPISIATPQNPLITTQVASPISCAIGSPSTNFPMQFGSSPKNASPLPQKQSTPQPIAPPSSKMPPPICPGISQSPVKLSDIGINQTLSSSPKDSKATNAMKKLPDMTPPQVPKLPEVAVGNLTKQEIKELAPKSPKTQAKGSPKVGRKEQQAEVIKNIIDSASKTLPLTQSKLDDPLKPVPLLTDFSQILSSTNPLTSFSTPNIEKEEEMQRMPADKNTPADKSRGVPIENKSKKLIEPKGSPITQAPLSLESLLENITGKEATKDILGSPSTEIKSQKADLKESGSLPVGSPKLNQKQPAKQQGNKNATEKALQTQQINPQTNISAEKLQDIKLPVTQNNPPTSNLSTILPPVLEQQRSEGENVKEVKPIQKPEIPKKPSGLLPTKQQTKLEGAIKAPTVEVMKNTAVIDSLGAEKISEPSNVKQDLQKPKVLDVKLENKLAPTNTKVGSPSESQFIPQDILGQVENQQSPKAKPSTPVKEQNPLLVAASDKTQAIGKKEINVEKNKKEQPKKEDNSGKGKDANEKKGKNSTKGATVEDFLKDPKISENVSTNDGTPDLKKLDKQISKQDKPVQKEVTSAATVPEKIEKLPQKPDAKKTQDVEKKPQEVEKKKCSDVPIKQEPQIKPETNKNDKTSGKDEKQEKSEIKRKSKEENVEKTVPQDQITAESKSTPTKAVPEKQNNKNDKNKQGQNKDVKQQKDEKDQKKEESPAMTKDTKQQQKVKEDVKDTQTSKQDPKEKQRKVSESEKGRKVSESEKVKKGNDNEKARKVSESEKTRKVSESEKTRKVSESEKSKKEQAKQCKASDVKQNVEKTEQTLSESVQIKNEKKTPNKQQQKPSSTQEENKGQGKGPKDKKPNEKATSNEAIEKSVKENSALVPEINNIPLKDASDNKKGPKPQPTAKPKDDKSKSKEATKEKVVEKPKAPATEKKELNVTEDKDNEDESGDGGNAEVTAAKKKRRRKKKNKKPSDGTQADGQQATPNKQPEKQEVKTQKKPKENVQSSTKQLDNNLGTKAEKPQAAKVEGVPVLAPVVQPKVVADVNKDKKTSENQEADTSQANKKKNKKKNRKGAGGDDGPQDTENDLAGQKKTPFDFRQPKMTVNPLAHHLSNCCCICKATSGNNQLPLQTCTACFLACYCCREHQVQHWPDHKEFCNYITSTLSERRPYFFTPAESMNQDERRQFKLLELQLCQKSLGRSLTPLESALILHPRACHTCYKPAFQNVCKKCYCINYCCDNHNPSNHQEWCSTFHIKLLFVQSQSEYGSAGVSIQKPSKVLYPFNSNMKDYLTSLDFTSPISMPRELYLAHMSELATYPLTLLQALQLLSKQGATNPLEYEHLVVHVVGAEDVYECCQILKWKYFFVNLLPKLKTLHLVFIGCELTIEDDRVHVEGRLAYEFHAKMTYLDYCKKCYIKPSIVCAFNSGLYRNTGYLGTDSWGPSLYPMLKLNPGAPVLLTAYTQMESHLDLQRVKELFLNSLQVAQSPIKNPFASIFPNHNLVSEHECPVAFRNYYMTIVRHA